MSVEETSVDFCQVKIKSCTNAENWRKLVEFFCLATIHLVGVCGGDIWEFRVSIFVLKNLIVKIKLEEFFFGNDPFGPVSVEETSGSFEFRFLS